MKVQLLARPDHSLFLYNYLKKLIDIRMINFNVAKKGTLLHKFYPSAKLVDDNAVILYDFILFHQLIFSLSKLGMNNPYKLESRYAELSYGYRANKFTPDIIHYWPIYCHKYAKNRRERNKITTVADVYSAHPFNVLEALRIEYDRYNLDIKNSYLYLAAKRDTDFLEHETNIITCSTYVKDSFKKFAPNCNFHIAEYGFLGDNSVMSNYENAIRLQKKLQKPVRFVYVGTVSIEKGVHYLLQAVKSMNSNQIQLDVIGSIKKGQERIFYPFQGVNGINFLGHKSNMEIIRTLPSYSVLVQPSLSDAYSIATIEGLQNALPVIVSNDTGNKDAIEKFKAGEVVKTADSEALATAIEKLMDFEYRRFLSENIRFFIEDDAKYPYPMKVLDIYSKLLAQS